MSLRDQLSATAQEGDEWRNKALSLEVRILELQSRLHESDNRNDL